MADLTTRDAKLVQYLNEAYGKERELETALPAHIAMTTRAPYRRRLQQHLTETKRHASELQRRVRQLGGDPEIVPLPGPEAIAKGAGAAVELGSRAVAAARAPLQAIRGTGEQEKMLKNAKTEYSDEHEEIATYRALEELAASLGDSMTAQLAKAIRREEERMASFLARLIPTLTKAVIQEEVPAAERRSSSRSRRGTKRSPSKRAGAKRATAKRAASGRTTRGTAKAATAKRATRAKRSTAKSPSAKRSAAKRPAAKASTAKRSTAKRSTAKRSTAKRATAKASTAKRSTAKRATAKASTAKRSTAKRSTAKRSTAKRSTAKRSTAKRSTAKTSTAKRSAAKRTTGRRTGAKASTARSASTRSGGAKQASRKAGTSSRAKR